jgi:hypothetical protein
MATGGSGGGGVYDAAWDYAMLSVSYRDMELLPIGATNSPLTGLGAGPAVAAEVVAAAEVAGVAMDTADELYFVVSKARLLEAGFDLEEDIHARVECAFTDSSAVANVDWTLHAKGVAAGAALTDAKSSADGVCTFPAIGSDAVGRVEATPWQPLVAAGVFKDDLLVLFAVTLADKGTATADLTWLLGVTLRGQRRLTAEDGVKKLT